MSRLVINGITVWLETKGTAVEVFSSSITVPLYRIGCVDLFLSACRVPFWKISLDGVNYRSCTAQTQTQAVAALVLKWQLNQSDLEKRIDIENANVRSVGKSIKVKNISIE